MDIVRDRGDESLLEIAKKPPRAPRAQGVPHSKGTPRRPRPPPSRQRRRKAYQMFMIGEWLPDPPEPADLLNLAQYKNPTPRARKKNGKPMPYTLKLRVEVYGKWIYLKHVRIVWRLVPASKRHLLLPQAFDRRGRPFENIRRMIWACWQRSKTKQEQDTAMISREQRTRAPATATSSASAIAPRRERYDSLSSESSADSDSSYVRSHSSSPVAASRAGSSSTAPTSVEGSPGPTSADAPDQDHEEVERMFDDYFGAQRERSSAEVEECRLSIEQRVASWQSRSNEEKHVSYFEQSRWDKAMKALFLDFVVAMTVGIDDETKERLIEHCLVAIAVIGNQTKFQGYRVAFDRIISHFVGENTITDTDSGTNTDGETETDTDTDDDEEGEQDNELVEDEEDEEESSWERLYTRIFSNLLVAVRGVLHPEQYRKMIDMCDEATGILAEDPDVEKECFRVGLQKMTEKYQELLKWRTAGYLEGSSDEEGEGDESEDGAEDDEVGDEANVTEYKEMEVIEISDDEDDEMIDEEEWQGFDD